MSQQIAWTAEADGNGLILSDRFRELTGLAGEAGRADRGDSSRRPRGGVAPLGGLRGHRPKIQCAFPDAPQGRQLSLRACPRGAPARRARGTSCAGMASPRMSTNRSRPSLPSARRRSATGSLRRRPTTRSGTMIFTRTRSTGATMPLRCSAWPGSGSGERRGAGGASASIRTRNGPCCKACAMRSKATRRAGRAPTASGATTAAGRTSSIAASSCGTRRAGRSARSAPCRT